jgi:hypothetical protein
MLSDITQRIAMETALRANEARLLSLVTVLQHPFSQAQEFLDFALHEAIRLTESKIGYIYHYDEGKKSFVLNSWSKDVMRECSIVKPQTCYDWRRPACGAKRCANALQSSSTIFRQPIP